MRPVGIDRHKYCRKKMQIHKKSKGEITPDSFRTVFYKIVLNTFFHTKKPSDSEGCA